MTQRYNGYSIGTIKDNGIWYATIFQECGDQEFHGRICYSIDGKTESQVIQEAKTEIDKMDRPYWRKLEK